MRLASVVMAGMILGCSSDGYAHYGDPKGWSGPYSMELVDGAGNRLATFEQGGRTYVLGHAGQPYEVRVHNGSGTRIEAVVSVDGRDVVDGKSAKWDKRGYLVEPWGSVVIDGFRVDSGSVAAFRFSSVAESYAARTGDARDVGVVGVAVFPERTPPPRRRVLRPFPPYGSAPRYDEDGNEEGLASADAAEAAGADGETASKAAPSRRSFEAPGESRGAVVSPPVAGRGMGGAGRGYAPPAPDDRPGLGTEFGERRGSRVSEVAFQRARPGHPDHMLALRYNDRPGLLALGIDVDGNGYRADETWTRESADPFRRSRGYSAPPPGWDGR